MCVCVYYKFLMYIEYVYFNNRGNIPKKKNILEKTDKAERHGLYMYILPST